MRCFSLIILVVLSAACSDTLPSADARSTDGRSGDGVTPPDHGVGDGGLHGNIGAACNPGKTGQCTGKAECLDVGGGVGVCTIRGCQPEDLKTPAIDDTCPTLGSGTSAIRTVCTEITTKGSSPTRFCLPKCTPVADANPCSGLANATLACDPVSLLQNGWSEVCMLPACKLDSNCGNRNALSPDSTCDLKTGTCRVRGVAGVKVGSACKTSTDCGPGQFCYAAHKDAAGKTVAEGGYCTVIGCSYGGPWTCPAGSSCVVLGSAKAFSYCLATGCNTAASPESDGCRDEASSGQYVCVPQGKDSVCVPSVW